MSKSFLYALLGLIIFACTTEKPNYGVNNAEIPAGLSKWKEQKFSMFIHWGLYSIPGGIWKGEQISGYSEQIQGHARIPREEYMQLADEFNPAAWNPDSVVLLAKTAGMQSVVITAKHHDGFSLFHTKQSAFNVVDATPYKRDILKELAAACARHGLRFGVYFSLIDWNYPGAMPFESTVNSDSIPPAHHAFNIKQVEELMTGYGEISEVWFDMGAPTAQQSKELVDVVKKHQPDCMVSGRIWNDQGDFIVMGDNKRPGFLMGVPWQTPASMYDETWGYRSWQEHEDLDVKVKEKIHDLVNIVSMGGNYLLNIGPNGNGEVVPFEKQVLQGVGAWMKTNGVSIYNTVPSPIEMGGWGTTTMKPGKLYLHMMRKPSGNMLIVPGLDIDVKSAQFLNRPGELLDAAVNSYTFSVALPEEITPDYLPVIEVEYDGEMVYSSLKQIQAEYDNSYVLGYDNARQYHSFSGREYYSLKPTVVKLSWQISPARSLDMMVTARHDSLSENRQYVLAVNGQEYPWKMEAGEVSKALGIINLHADKPNTIELWATDRKNPHVDMEAKGLKIVFSL